MSELATSSKDPSTPSAESSSEDLTRLSSRSSMMSSSVHLARSRQTWTGTGSAAGYVLRYLGPMRRLMMDVVGSEKEADRALAILVAHLVKAGFSGHDKGRLRDFLVRGIRSAAKARFEEANQDVPSEAKQDGKSITPLTPPRVEVAQLESVDWVGYWRECILQRAWRALERYQHAYRQGRKVTHEPTGEEGPQENLIHDSLRVAMSYPRETIQQWSGRVTAMSGLQVTVDQLQEQLELARVRFAQLIADEIAQTLELSESKAVQAEIKTLGLAKAFAGVKVLG